MARTAAYNVHRLYLARWARRVSWSEVPLIFGVTWGVVNRAIRWVVGMACCTAI
jgi:hypothetical protein